MALDKNKLGWIALVVILVAFGIFLYFVLRTPSESSPRRPIWDNENQSQNNERISDLEKKLETEKRRRFELGRIALQNSDGIVRRLVEELSKNPRLVSWLANDNLINRFVTAVDNVAQGKSPGDQMPFLRPSSAFQINGRTAPYRLNPVSFKRYDQAVDIFGSLDVQGCAELYQELMPLFQEAYRQLGYPEGDFHQQVKKAIIELLRAPVVEGPIYLKPKVVTYEFWDPSLEKRSAAQKHVIRLGPDNTRRFQAKLRQLATAIGIPETDLPGPRVYQPQVPPGK